MVWLYIALFHALFPAGILQQAVSLPECASICSFCSRMKRGRLYACARREGYNVLAMGQHLDDLAESFLMSAFHNGFIRTMKANYTVKWVPYHTLYTWRERKRERERERERERGWNKRQHKHICTHTAHIQHLLTHMQTHTYLQGGGPQSDSTIRLRSREGLASLCRQLSSSCHCWKLPSLFWSTKGIV